MEITSIRYGRKFNLGNYESEEIAFEGVLEEGDSPLECLEEMKTAVMEAWKGPTPEPTPEEDEEVEEGSEANDDDDEFIDDDTEESEGEGETEEEDPKPSKKKTKKKATKKAAKKTTTKKKTTKKNTSRKKNTPYDRGLELHKKLLGEMLAEEVPNWKKDKDLKAACQSASRDMEGEDFLNSDGEVLDSFKEEFVEKIGE